MSATLRTKRVTSFAILPEIRIFGHALHRLKAASLIKFRSTAVPAPLPTLGATATA